MNSLGLALDVIEALSGELHISTFCTVFASAWGLFRSREFVVNLLEAGVIALRPDGVVVLTHLGADLRAQLGELVELVYELDPHHADDTVSPLELAVLRAVGNA